MSPTIIERPKADIAPSLLEELQTFTETEGQVIVHCIMSASQYGTYIRIWPTTYLIDKIGSHRSELVLAENITYYPIWQQVPPGSSSYFTLIFSKLPRSCKQFDLREVIPAPGGFEVLNINRNDTDVYFVRL